MTKNKSIFIHNFVVISYVKKIVRSKSSFDEFIEGIHIYNLASLNCFTSC